MKREIRKILFVLLLTLSVFALAACSKDEPDTEPGNREVTATPEVTSEPEPTQEATGEPTAEPTPVVTEAPTGKVDVISDASEGDDSGKTENQGIDPTDTPTDLPTEAPTDTPTDTPVVTPQIVIDENDAMAGYYKISSYNYEVEEFSVNDMLSFFESKGIILGGMVVEGNGKAIIRLFDNEDIALSYDESCFFDDEDGDRISYVFENDTLTLTEEGFDNLSMVFVKMTPEEIELFNKPIDDAAYNAVLMEFLQYNGEILTPTDIEPTSQPVSTGYTNEAMVGKYKVTYLLIEGTELYDQEFIKKFEDNGIILYAMIVEPNGKATIRSLDFNGSTSDTELSYDEKYFYADGEAEVYTFENDTITIIDSTDPDKNMIKFVKMNEKEIENFESPVDAELLMNLIMEMYAAND